MAILGFGKDKDKKEEKQESSSVSRKDVSKKKDKKEGSKKTSSKNKEKKAPDFSSKFDAGKIILNPRITEKSTIISDEENAYTFDVHTSANKKEVAKAVESIYEVKPVRVNIINRPRKKVTRRGKVGFKSGGKKAIVYLREGDKIEFV